MCTRITQRSGALSPFHRPCFIAPWRQAVNYSRNFVYIIYISLHYKWAECRASDKKCNKVGHFARVCRATERKESQRENRKPVNRKKGKNYKVCAVAIERQSWVGEEDSRSEKKHVLSKGKDDRVLININGRKIKMVADIGCGQNIIPSQLYKDGIQFKRCPLKHTNVCSVWSAISPEMFGILGSQLDCRYEFYRLAY